MTWKWIAMAAVAAGIAAGALAGDGVIEINQDKALAGQVTPNDGPGFPVLITRSGSYRLTSSLTVPSGTDGITITASDVTLDLNGFSVESTYACCAGGGFGHGIRAVENRTWVRDGNVAGFPENGVLLGAFAHVERVVVRQVGAHGIELSGGGIAIANRVNQVGQSGLRFSGGEPGVYRDNVLTNPGLAPGSTAFALAGLARASGGNYCADGSCSPRGRRRFYITTNRVSGDLADTACTTGFRLAKEIEIWEMAGLEYGHHPSIAHTGSFSNRVAWVHEENGSGDPDCLGFTSNSSAERGLILQVSPTSPVTTAPFDSNTSACNFQYPVWCIED